MSGREDKSTDAAVRQMLDKAEREGVVTVWDRYKDMQRTICKRPQGITRGLLHIN